MKGKQMSAILAILLMLSGALFVPRTFAVTPADAVQSNPLSINWMYPTHVPGEQFIVYVDVVNVVDLFAFQCGFYFDNTVLGVNKVEEGGFLTNNGADGNIPFPGSIDNATGTVNAYGWTLTDTTKAKTGSGHLLKITMDIISTLWPPYSDGSPGGPVTMIDLTDVDMDAAETILMYKDGVTEIPVNNLYDGDFTLYVTISGPTAKFTFSPAAPYVGDLVTFDGHTSTGGFDGTNVIPIVDYMWDFGDGNVTHTPGSIVDHRFTAPATYNVCLTVTDANNGTDTVCHPVIVYEKLAGPMIDLQSQRIRYIDPTTYVDPFYGAGPNVPCDSFRPGDWVQLWAKTYYNEDPVQYQLVAFEVKDNQGNTVVAGSALSDSNGWALYEFRIPWPCDGPEPEFGVWCAVAKWSIGELGGKPWMKTINDTMCWHVSWGLEIVNKTEEKAEYYKGDLVVIKLWVENQYMIPINATITGEIYDDLMVPLGMAILEGYTFDPMSPWSNPNVQMVQLTGIEVPKWAYVGRGTAKANLFTKLPFKCGTAFCPEVTNNFTIKKSLPDWEPDP